MRYYYHYTYNATLYFRHLLRFQIANIRNKFPLQRRSAPKRPNSHGHEADDNSVWDITGIQHHKCNPMGALLWGDLDKISDPRSVWIMVHQRNRWIHDQTGFIRSFDAPCSRQILDHWSWSRPTQRNAAYNRNTWLLLPPAGGSLSTAFCPGFPDDSLTGETVKTLCERGGRGKSCLHCCMMSIVLFPASSRWKKCRSLAYINS